MGEGSFHVHCVKASGVIARPRAGRVDSKHLHRPHSRQSPTWARLLALRALSRHVETLEVQPRTARRFILGRQGLWPGRRWTAREGIERAVHEACAVQVDSLDVVGRSQDLALASRVEGYRPVDLQRGLYQQRSLFEWGGGLFIRPIEEFPYLIHRMREVGLDPSWESFGRTHRALISRVLRAVKERGPLGSRDLPEGCSVESYRASKDTGLALYYLWHTGKLVIHHRAGGSRVYDLTSRTIPRQFLHVVPARKAREHLVNRSLNRWGLPNASEVHSALHWAFPRGHSPKVTRGWIATQERQGTLVRVEISGWSKPHWTDPLGAYQLSELERDGLPGGWQAVGTTTEEEATFLAPLDVVCTGGRARRIFGFDYIWEVYVPAPKRKWGYYTLPILYKDRLTARADLRYDRATGVLRVLGFWFEHDVDASDATFARAVGSGLARLRDMVVATRVDLTPVRPRLFARRLKSTL